jgi:Cys-tRNA(Pro) deacylase
MNLIAYLKINKIWFQIVEKNETVHTADAATATGIPLEKVTKSLVFLDENKTPILVVIPGDCNTNKQKLKAVLAVKDIDLAPFNEAEKYSGYEPGATPPVCHKNIKRVVIDKKVMQYQTVFGGGGSRKKLVELKTEDIQKLNNAIVADIAEVKK